MDQYAALPTFLV